MSNPEVETFPEGVGRSRIAAGTLISVSCAERMCGEAGLMTCVMCPRRSLITSDIHCIETRLLPPRLHVSLFLRTPRQKNPSAPNAKQQ